MPDLNPFLVLGFALGGVFAMSGVGLVVANMRARDMSETLLRHVSDTRLRHKFATRLRHDAGCGWQSLVSRSLDR